MAATVQKEGDAAAYSFTVAVVCAIMRLPPASTAQRTTLLAAQSMVVPKANTMLAQALKPLCGEAFGRLLPGPRDQVLWLFSELLHRRVPECESLTAYIMRCIATGNPSADNQALEQSFVSILSANMFAFSTQTTTTKETSAATATVTHTHA